MPADGARRARIVLVPGAFDTVAEFSQAGFEDAVRMRGLDLDLDYAELSFATLTDRSMIDRLRDGPLRRARAAGCRSVWLAGISLGGYMALACAERFRDELDGLCLIAPYLGTRIVMRSIERSGGLAGWNATAVAADDEDVAIWRFIRASADWRAPIYLGYGRDDRFADGQRLCAAALPAEAVDVVEGAHDWPTWRAIWEHFLDKWPTLGARRTVGSAA
jgi:pimeloyl-ACP methyl ester carboxylesterase